MGVETCLGYVYPADCRRHLRIINTTKVGSKLLLVTTVILCSQKKKEKRKKKKNISLALLLR
jgi:hypothetical protein